MLFVRKPISSKFKNWSIVWKRKEWKFVKNGWGWYIFEHVFIERYHSVLFLIDSLYSSATIQIHTMRLCTIPQGYGCRVGRYFNQESALWARYLVDIFSNDIFMLWPSIIQSIILLFYLRWLGLLGIRATENRFTVMVVSVPLKYKLDRERLYWMADVH